MPQPTIVKAASPADLLALIPHLVGFEPRESVVFVPFRGKRTHGALRLDLPRSAKAHKGLVTFAIGTLCKLADVDGLAAIIFTSESVAGPLPHRDFAQVAARRIRHAGFALKDVLVQGSDGWASYLDESLRGSLEQIRASAVNDEVPALVPVDLSFEFAPPEILAEVEASFRRQPGDVETSIDPVEFVELAPTLEDLKLAGLAYLFLMLFEDQLICTATMLQWASPDTEHRALWRVCGSHPETTEAEVEAFGSRLRGEGSRPDLRRIEAGIAFIQKLLFFTVTHRRPPLFCMLAWLHWALGRGSAAGRCLEEALAIDSELPMALALQGVLRNGMLPEWAFAEATS